MSKLKHKQLVVISDDQDVHIPFVQRHLAEPLYVLDPQMLLEGGKLSYELQENSMVLHYQDTPLHRVTGAWYRKPRFIDAAQVPVAANFKHYAVGAISNYTMLLLTAFPRARWISDYYNIWRASNKSWQLEVAARLGFRVPATVITSDAEAARRFIDQYSRVIVKPMAFGAPIVDGNYKTFFATILDKTNLPDLSNLHLAPAIFQEAIDPAYDVRVTVVGSKVFAAAIHIKKQDHSSPVRDWRPGQYNHNLRLEKFSLPAVVARLCIEHVKAMGLLFGAIDLVMDTKGHLWFLENNPNGQWAFVEEATDQPIGNAVAALLAR